MTGRAPEVRPIAAEASRPIRGEVLRPGRPAEELVFAEDEAPDTLHLGAFVDGRLVAVGRVSREAPPSSDEDGAWRIRGMATLPAERGGGAGGAVLNGLLDHAAASGGTLAWCNARVAARAFYERFGFAAVGPPFEVEGIGPHLFMRRTVQPEAPR